MDRMLCRGKRIDNNEWAYGYYLLDGVTGQTFIFPSDNSVNETDKIGEEGLLRFVAFEVDPETVGQYTLKKDKKDNKIFSGDIMEGGYLNPLTGLFMSRKFVIVYRNAWYIGELIGHSPYGDTWLNHIEGEVIGNIHDNPELLKRQED